MPLPISEKVAHAVYSSYKSLKPISKPCVRSNGQKEWTVLAAMVAIDGENDEVRVVSLGTGVKATPNEELRRSNGRILHDCHAETIAIRGFNSVLLKEISAIRGGFKSYLIEESSKGYTVKNKWKFGLYISRLPCGDASMEFLECEDKNSGDLHFESWCKEGGQLSPTIQTILRGRDNYASKGFVRTKPGRADSSITLSKSCSDKLTLRQIFGLFNASNWFLFDDMVFLEYLILPRKYQQYQSSLERCFHERVSTVDASLMNFLFCESEFIDDKTDTNQVPGSISACLLNCTEKVIEESILNGIKNGFFVKGNNPLRKNCHSVISRFGQWTDLKMACDKELGDYLTFKSSLVDRTSYVKDSKNLLSSDGWVCTLSDNCS